MLLKPLKIGFSPAKHGLVALIAINILLPVCAQTNARPPASQPAAIPLWPLGAPEYRGLPWTHGAPGAKGTQLEDVPSLQPYLAPADKANGAAMVFCPSGEYATLSAQEGQDVARWFNNLGVAVFVLKYRLGPRYQHPAMFWDVQRAIRYVRGSARRWKLDPQRIGVMGFAAGGHLAATAATHFDEGQVEYDGTEWYSSRPDVTILGYPVITMTQQYTHAATRANLLGAKPSTESVEFLSNEKQVTVETPPVFLFHTKDDPVVPVENSLMFAEALRRNRVPHELQLFEHGPHGVGLAQNDPVLSQWPKRLEQWLSSRGFLTPRLAPTSYRPSALVALIKALRATPPEFAASKLIHIASLHTGSYEEWKRELLVAAFQIAEQVQHPVKLKSVGLGQPQPDMASRAFELGMDKVSLQTTAIMELLKFDRKKALELGTTMIKLQIPTSRCEDSLMPEVDAFYTMLMYLTSDCFTPAQKQRNADLAFIEPFILAIEHPSQVGPAARIVNTLGVMMEPRARLIQTFARALANVGNDDRAFSADQHVTIQAMLNLGYQANSREMATDDLMEQLRDYIVRQLNAPRCADNVASADSKPVIPGVAEQFNLSLSLSKRKLDPISTDEIRTVLQEGQEERERRARTRRVEPSPQAKRIQEKLQAFRSKADARERAMTLVRAGQQTNMRVIETEPPLSVEDLPQLNELLAELAQWKPEHEATESDYFHQRCRVYNSILELLPRGETAQRLLDEYLAFLSASPLRNQNFIEWYWHVNALFQKRRIYADGKQWPMEGVINSSDPVLQINARLESVVFRATPQ